MSSIEKAAAAYAEFLQAIGLDSDNSEIDIADSAKHTAELMTFWMSGLNAERPQLSQMKAYGREIVSLHHLPFYSFCGHHFVPFFGSVDIDYIPNDFIAGLGGFMRVIEYYSRRPQFQERLCSQIAEHIFEDLHPQSVRVQIKARQMCMELQGEGAGIEIETLKLLGKPF